MISITTLDSCTFIGFLPITNYSKILRIKSLKCFCKGFFDPKRTQEDVASTPERSNFLQNPYTDPTGKCDFIIFFASF